MEGLLWNKNLHYCDYKNPPLVLTESQINSIEITVSCDLAFFNLMGANQLCAHKTDETGFSGMLECKMSLYC